MTISLVINLLIASLLSALLYVILKYFEKFKINNLHGLTINYFTASLFSFFAHYKINIDLIPTIPVFGAFAISVGLLFILVFYLAAITSQKAGIAITSIAGKMSMVIPIAAGIFFYNDKVNFLRIVGIALAITAVYLGSKKSNSNNSDKTINNKSIWLYPLLLFIGSGLVDTCIKYSQQYYMTQENQYLFFSVLFGTAGIFGFIGSIIQYLKQNIKLSLSSLAGGIILGIVNYYSLVFLVNCLATDGAESAIIFSIANMLVVFYSAIFALVIFKEKLSKTNLIGLLLAFIAILILSN